MKGSNGDDMIDSTQERSDTVLQEAGNGVQSSENFINVLSMLCPNKGNNEEQQVAFDLERHLVAWVLLTRFDVENLEQAWDQYGPTLERFAVEILLKQEGGVVDHDDGRDDDQQLLSESSLDHQMVLRYLRLVAQVTSRLSSTSYPKALGQAIFHVWKPLSDVPLSVHMDVCFSLEVFLMADPVLSNALSLLETIWNRYRQEVERQGTHTKEETHTGMASKIRTEETSKNDLNKQEDQKVEQEWNIMGETLDQILDNKASDNVDDSLRSTSSHEPEDVRAYSLTAYHELILGIFSQEGIEEIIPASVIPSILQWTSHPVASLDKSLQMVWNEWFLTWITTRNTQQAASSSSSFGRILRQDPYNQALLGQPEMLAQLQHMLLSHVVSPPNAKRDDSSLRAMAWQAVVALVEVNGFDWILSSSLRNSGVSAPRVSSIASAQKLGSGTLLCTWIRLAAGELRIQLQPLVTSPEPRHGSTHSALGGWQATGLPTGHGCARLLQSVVRYLIQLADRPHLPMPLSGDALLHLRQSLEQALFTSVEYLSLITDRTTGNILDATMHDDRASLFHAILRLLGTLLMEVDIFDLLEKNHPIVTDMDNDDKDQQEEASSSPSVILNCLKRVLPIAEDPSLLPGLVHILGDAEDDYEKQKLLVDTLYEPMLDYLEWYWQNGATMTKALNPLDDTVAWACSCTELWVQLSSAKADSTTTSLVAQHRRRLCLAVLTWIQNILQTNDPSSRNYLSLVLGCYMTLSKDQSEPPKEHEKRVILRALQWCETG